MIEYRPFRNTDPPAICEIWRNHPPLRALFQPMTPVVFENTVLSKPYFDRHGLIVAVEDRAPIGFVHAGFAANADGSAVDYSAGATCMLMVAHHANRARVARELLDRSEAYLRGRGASVMFGGGVPSVAPFYLGLYGGCRVPGVLASDQWALDIYRDAGYTHQADIQILHRELAGFRPVVDRQQIEYRRSCLVQSVPDPPVASWWAACTEGLVDRYAFTASSRRGRSPSGTAVFWDMEPLASSWGVHARGLLHLEIATGESHEAFTTFLIGEALRLLAQQGATLAEVQVSSQDDPLAKVCKKLGFQEVELAHRHVKQVPS